MFASRCSAHRTSAVPLRNATTRRGAQDDDAKHDPSSPGDPSLNLQKHEVDPDVRAQLRDRRSATPGPPALVILSLAAYLRVAHIYILISMPTGTSTIFGAFQAIWLSFFETGRTPPSDINYCGSKSSPMKSFVLNHGQVFVALQKNSRSCAGHPGQNGVGSSLS